jgi:proteasome lid subunit RPN8/RPN11
MIRDGACAVEFNSAVLQQIRRHARGSMAAEICGVLIGDVTNAVTRVEACIAGEKATEGGAHVTFTQETWQHIYKIKDTKFPGSSIVGWYHSHPGFGIFLSDYDLFIHKNFFTAAHQVAWVFDPHSDEEGCFGWASGEIVSLKRFCVLQEHAEADEKARQVANDGRTIAPTTLERPGEGDWKRPPSTMGRLAVYSLAAVLVCIAGFLLYRHFAHPESLREKMRTSQSAAHDRQPRQGLAEWERRKANSIDERLSSREVEVYLRERSHFVRRIYLEAGPVTATTIDGTDNLGKNDNNVLRFECLVTYYWNSVDQPKGHTAIRYTYDNQKHHADPKDVASNASSDVDKRELSEITKGLADLLFKEN